MAERRGFSLIEVLLAVVVATIGLMALFRVVAETADATGRARRWLAMTLEVEAQAARLEQAYRFNAPSCLLPAAGSLTTPEGISLGWSVAGDSAAATFAIEVRAAAARRTLIDTVVTGVLCQ